MKEFALVVTILLQGSPPTTIDQRFSTRPDCESARLAVLKNAALVSAKLRIVRKERGLSFEIPKTAAVCTEM